MNMEVIRTRRLLRFVVCCCYGVLKNGRERVSWGEWNCGYRIGLVVVAFVEEVAFLGRCSVHVGYCISQVFDDNECITGIVRVYGGAVEDVVIEYSS